MNGISSISCLCKYVECQRNILTQNSQTANNGDQKSIAVIFIVSHSFVKTVIRPATVLWRRLQERWNVFIHYSRHHKGIGLPVNVQMINCCIKVLAPWIRLTYFLYLKRQTQIENLVWVSGRDRTHHCHMWAESLIVIIFLWAHYSFFSSNSIFILNYWEK